MSQQTPVTMELAAFAQALCDVMAVPCAEIQVIRELLDRKGIVSKEEFENSIGTFPQERFQVIASDLNNQVRSKVRQIIQEMRKPGHVH